MNASFSGGKGHLVSSHVAFILKPDQALNADPRAVGTDEDEPTYNLAVSCKGCLVTKRTFLPPLCTCPFKMYTSFVDVGAPA